MVTLLKLAKYKHAKYVSMQNVQVCGCENMHNIQNSIKVMQNIQTKPYKPNLPDQINMDIFLLSSSICNILNTYFPFIMR